MNVFNRTVAEIDLNGIKRNIRKLLDAVNPDSLTAIVKANAYGLGAVRIAEICLEAGADSLGVADLNEALELKNFECPIMILGGILAEEIPLAVENDIIMPVNSLDCARKISVEAGRQKRQAKFQILIDTGMGRLGIPLRDAFETILEIMKLPHIDCVGIYSHFPVADIPRCDYTLRQIEGLKKLVFELTQEKINFQYVHIANSDAVHNYPEACKEPFNRIRTGLSIYGYNSSNIHGVESVLTLKSKLVLVRTLPAGSFIGYGRTHSLKRETRVGTVAAGYADGIPLALSNQGEVLIRGKRCSVIGRISMDYTTVDLSPVPDAESGDEVVFVGNQDSETITLQSWAQVKNTHEHDILCALKRAKCVYV